jgi:hypothetical protein
MSNQGFIPNRQDIHPHYNQYSKPSCNLNTSQFYSNKEAWNDKQFQRNSEAFNIHKTNYNSYQNAMNITFSENYKKQRIEANQQYQKRLDDYNSVNNNTNYNAKLGLIDFQDDTYKNYLKTKDTKKNLQK